MKRKSQNQNLNKKNSNVNKPKNTPTATPVPPPAPTDPIRKKRAQIQPQASDISIALSGIETEQCLKRLDDIPRERQLLLSFRGNSPAGIKNSVIQFLKEDSNCIDAVILRKCPGDVFKVNSTNEALQNSTYKTKFFPGVFEVLAKRAPVIVDKNFAQWKALFKINLKYLILIPINVFQPHKGIGVIESIVVLAFENQLPIELEEGSTWNSLIAFCNLTAPLLINVQRNEESQNKLKGMTDALDSIRNVEKQIQDLSSCINTIGLELHTVFHAAHAVVFLMLEEPYDPKLFKYCSFGGARVDNGCPKRQSHSLEELPQELISSYAVGWTALHKKCLRVNDPSELEEFIGHRKEIHAIGGCIVKNIMCFVIDDLSGDMPLVVELSGKEGGFSENDESAALLFADRVSSVLSSSVMLDYRRRAVRRNDITNEVINNIKTINVTNVKHLLDMKFNYSTSFRRKFLSFRYVIKPHDFEQLPGALLFIFTELGFITRWKIRRATLIRFILSMEQGYRDNAYHNWRHGFTVTHFAFLLLKKLELQNNGYLNDIEALALIVSCMCHDVDHRGLNSRFMGLFNSDSGESYHIYKQEEGLMQRQHVAVTLQILSSDECNILENLGDQDYREFIELVQWNILSTDIGIYIKSQQDLLGTLKTFDKNIKEDRRSLLSILMTVCDFCETAVKPWNDYIITVRSIFFEFFAQGDEEVKLGFTPIPTMDRRVAYIPLIEMKFINEIVRPAYEAISEIFPRTEECLQTIDYYKELWLVATKIFEDNARLENPLMMLDLPEMKEEHLRSIAYPELKRHASRIRHSIGSLPSLQLVAFSKLSIRENLGNSTNDLGVLDQSYQSTSKRSRSCKESLKHFFCCFFCRRRALYDASFLRRYNQEEAFMEERSQIYERKRSNDSSDLNIRNFRGRINSISST